MKLYYRLVAGAALGALALATAAPADAKAKPHKHGAARKHVDPRDAKIRALEDKIDALTQRLDAQDAAQAATSQQAQSAQAAAAAAQTSAATALSQSQANTVEVAQIKTTPPAKPPAPGWWGSTTIGGRAFFNVSDIHQTSTNLLGVRTDNAQNGTQTELKRFYLIVDHKFNDVFSANVTTDFRYNSNGTSKDTLVYLKKAYVQAKFSPAFFVRIGEADLPWVPFVESVYGYRFVENTLIDRTKFGTSADWGIHIGGTFGNGFVSYAASAINGAGYKTLTRQSDTMDLEGRISVNPIKTITLAVGGYTGKRSLSAGNLPDLATPHTAERFDALAAYTDKRVRLGLEYFAAKNWNNVNTLTTDKSDGWSAFGSFAFTPKIGVFGRYDWVKPNKDTVPSLKDHYFNVGVDYKPLPPLDFALVYKRERANNGTLPTSNGTIGGADHGIYDEFGLFGQFSF